MRTNFEFTRPQSLKIGEVYLYREHNIDGNHQVPRVVSFVNYAPCPAIVIIKFSNGRAQRCLREDLFEPKIVARYQKAAKELFSFFQHYITLVKIHLANIYQNIRTALLYPAN
jgi:hypothetical protein